MGKLSFILFCFFLFETVIVVAGGSAPALSGYITDRETGDRLQFVSVAVYEVSDSSLVDGVVTDADGTFTFRSLPEGQYFLEATFIGYEKVTVPDINISAKRTSVALKSIALPPAVTQLDEVSVVADEMSVEYRIDRKVINVSQQLTSASGNAVDILMNIPSITVDVDGTVSLRGSTGFMVLIDDRPTVLEPSEALQQIPANTIENIEIITNPSAKYNPDGTAGIINIVTKRNKLKGLSGTADADVGNFGRYGIGTLVNYNKKKWNVFLGGDFNESRGPGFSFSERRTVSDDTTYYTRSEGESDRKRHFWVVRGGAGYNVTDKDVVNFEFNYGYRNYERFSDQDFREGIEPAGVLEDYLSNEEGQRHGHFYSVQLQYRHDFAGKGHNLSSQIMYQNRISEEFSLNQLLNQNGAITSGQRSTEYGPGGILQLNLDYVLPRNETDKFEAGYQSRIGASTDETGLYVFNPESGDYEAQPTFFNDTEYSRDIHALYSLYSGEIGKFGYQAGLRGEYTYRTINTNVTAEKFTIDRFDYFPTLHTSLKLPAGQQVMASYSRRIERPRSYYLEPFVTWEDAFNVRQGNPDLNPEYIDAMEMAYLLELGQHAFSMEAYYRITNNKVERIQSVYDENVMLSKPANVGRDYALGAEAVLNLNLLKWWKADISGNFYQYRLNGALEEQAFDRSSFNWNTRLSNTFRFETGTRIQLNSRYNSATVTAQGTRGDYWTADIAVSQEFFERTLTAIVQVRDMFGRVVRDSESSGINFTYFGESYDRAPQVALTLNYRFNNYKSKRNRALDGGDDF
jgi:outer membrane cobalamin receptor